MLVTLVLLLCGCSVAGNYSQFSGMAQFSSSQNQLARDLYEQKKLFQKLFNDARKSNIHKGQPKEEILYLYKQPLLVRRSFLDGGEVFIYHHPDIYFNGPQVKLIFNKDNKLDNWLVTGN